MDRDELALAALPKKGKAAVVASCKVSNDGFYWVLFVESVAAE